MNDFSKLIIMNHLSAGDILWNGAKVTDKFAKAYNARLDSVQGWLNDGKLPPDELLNGLHNMIANHSSFMVE